MEGHLARRFRQGEREALETVYREHVGAVERVVRRSLAAVAALSAGALEDLVQDVFLKAFSPVARTSYDGLRDYGPYLLTIARNVVIDWARRSGREIPSDVVEAMKDSSWEEDPAVFAPDLVSLTARYVESLPPDLRGVHQHRFILAQSQRDAARALGISRQNLRTLEQKLVAGLRRQLQQAGLTADLAAPPVAPQPPVIEDPRGSLANARRR